MDHTHCRLQRHLWDTRRRVKRTDSSAKGLLGESSEQMPQRLLCQATLESLPDRPLANYPLRVEGIETTALIDTGAEGNFIDEKFVKRH